MRKDICHLTRSAVNLFSTLPVSIENKLFGSCLTMFDSSTVGVGWKTPNGNTFGTFPERPVMRCEKISFTWWSNSAAAFVRNFTPTCSSVARSGGQAWPAWASVLTSFTEQQTGVQEIVHPCSERAARSISSSQVYSSPSVGEETLIECLACSLVTGKGSVHVCVCVCAWVWFHFMLKSSWKCLHSERPSKKRQSMGRKVNSSCRRHCDSSLNVSPDRQFISAAANATRLALVLIWDSLSRWIDEAVLASAASAFTFAQICCRNSDR